MLASFNFLSLYLKASFCWSSSFLFPWKIETEGLFFSQTLATKDTSCESVVTSGQLQLTSQHPPRDASPAGLVGIWLLRPFLSLCFVTIASLCLLVWLCGSVCMHVFLDISGL